MKIIIPIIAIIAVCSAAPALLAQAPVTVTVPEIERPTTAELWRVIYDYGTDVLAESEGGEQVAVWDGKPGEPTVIIQFRGISGPIENSEGVQLNNLWNEPAFAHDRWVGTLQITGNLAKTAMTANLSENIRTSILAYMNAHPEMWNQIQWQRV